MKYRIIIFALVLIVNHKSSCQTCVSTQAIMIEHKADSLMKIFNYDTASILYCKAADLYIQDQDWLNSAKNYRLAGNARLKTAKPDSAFNYIEKALTIAETHFRDGNKEEMFEKSDILLSYSKVLEQKGNYDEELLFCNKALELVLQTDSLNKERIASVWNKKGFAYKNIGKFDSALHFCQKALDVILTNSVDIPEELGSIYNSIGVIYFNKGEYNKALEYFQKSLQFLIAILNEQSPDIAQIYDNIGIIYSCKGDYEKALEYFQKALITRIAIYNDQHPDIAQSFYNIGLTYYYKGMRDEAFEYFQKALQIRIAVFGELHPDVSRSYNSIGIVYFDNGLSDKALEYYQKALRIQIAISGEENAFVALIYYNIGIIHHCDGEFDKALEYYQRALQIRNTIFGENHPAVAESYSCIGSLYNDKGELEKALQYHQKALQLRLALVGEQNREVAMNYENIGLIYFNKRDYDKALEYFQKAFQIQIVIFGEQHSDVAISYANIGRLYSGKKEYEKALELYQKALQIQIAIFDKKHPDCALTYQYAGVIFEHKNDYITALQYFQKSLIANLPEFNDTSVYANPRLENILSKPILLQSLSGKANAFFQVYKNNTVLTRDLEASLATYELAFKLTQNMRNEYTFENTQLLLSENTKANYIKATHVALEYDKINPLQANNTKTFEFIEKGKSAILSAELNIRNFTGIPDSLTEVERDLKSRINNLTTSITVEKNIKEGYDTLKVNALENESFSCSRKLDSLIISFENNYPSYYDLKYSNKIVTIPEIKESLDHKTALLSYFIGDSILFITTITDSLYNIREFNIDSTFKPLITGYYKNLKTAEPESLIARSQRIYKLLISPVEEYIAQKEHLIIIPDDYLYYLPFETLIKNYIPGKDQKTDYSKPDYLIKDHSVTYNHSATVWYNSRKKVADQSSNLAGNFIGFAPVFNEDNDNGIILSSNINAIDTTGHDLAYRSISTDMTRFNPLPYSKDEVTSIIHLFEKQKREAKAYLYSQASESNFKNDAGNYSFVHISSHGFSNDKEPKLSGIVFSQPADSITLNSQLKEDGILYAGETYGLNLNADLVVLSSCEGGLGKLVKGEGLQALSRGFLSAGCPNVIFSLWKALDKPTQNLMVDFYSSLLEGQSYSEALRQAKLNLIRDPKTAFPHIWGGFVLTGR